MVATVRAMGRADWAALCFTAGVVALKVADEISDIRLCTVAIHRNAESLNRAWRTALIVLCGARLWLFLPAMVMTIPTVVALIGGDALSVCFNGVAILFLTDIDNVAYSAGLSDQFRGTVQRQVRNSLEEVRVRNAFHVRGLLLVFPTKYQNRPRTTRQGKDLKDTSLHRTNAPHSPLRRHCTLVWCSWAYL